MRYRARMPEAVVLVVVDGDERRFLPTVHAQLDAAPGRVVIAARSKAELECFADLDVDTMACESPSDAVNAVWRDHGRDVFLVGDAVLVPDDALARAQELLGRDLRFATVSFFSNDAGPLSLPTNEPTPQVLPGFDHRRLTNRLRSVAPELGPCPVPYAAGGAVLVSHVVLSAVGGFEVAPPEVSLDAVVADFSFRARSRGFIDLLDPETFVTRHLRPGEPMNRPVLRDPDRAWLVRRHPQLLDAVERELRECETPLSIATRAARVKAQGLRVLVDDATLGPFETGAQITTLAIIDTLARRDDVSEVGVALASHIPPYARDVLGQAKVRPALVADGAYDVFRGYDVAHRTAQPDKNFDLRAVRRAASRVVLTVLDLIAYRAGSYHATADDWLEYRDVLRRGVAGADAVTTISEDVATMMALERLPIERDRVFPILYGTEHVSGRESAEVPAELGRDGFLAAELLVCLGTDYTHKNRDLAIAVHRELRDRGRDVVLVVAGASTPHGSSRIAEDQLVRSTDGVVLLPNVSSGERNWLFRHAAAVLYPTSAEGFGLVPFEAARFGAPTVTVGFGPLLETSESVPVVAPSWDVEVLADCVDRLLGDPVLRREQVEATLAAADGYSWARTVDAFVDMYRVLLGRPARQEP